MTGRSCLRYTETLMTPAILPLQEAPTSEWYVVQTRSRHEKSVCEQLSSKQIETFLPLYRTSKRWKNGQVGAQLPLFAGYLFVRIPAHSKLSVLQTPGVARFLGFGNKPALVPDEEIAKLEIAVTNGDAVCPHPFLTGGERIRIRTGPLAGLTGILVHGKKRDRVVLSVELISRSISVELDTVDVEAI